MYLSTKEHDKLRTIVMGFEIPFRTYIAQKITLSYPDASSFFSAIDQITLLKCSQFPSCVDFTGFNCIQNCVYCYYLSFFSKIALKHRPHYFHI